MLEKEVPIVKHVGANGQVSLGKEYAGRQIQISKLDDGVLLIKMGKFIPDNELWLYKNQNELFIDNAIKWVESHKRSENLDEIEKIIENE